MSLEFDIGPLTWVKGEIDQALAQALANAAEFADAPADTTPLRYCLTHVHQVSGAVAMVGLDGVQRFSAEIEHYVAALEKRQIDPSAENLAILPRALRALVAYLQELVEGAADVPLRLFPEFKAMLDAQGATRVLESELFFPDLSNSAPGDLETSVPEGVPLPTYLDEQCQRYRRDLVQWLRAPENTKPLLDMRDALLAVERSQALPAQKTLWWASVGLLEAIAGGEIVLGQNVRHLCARLERHLHYLAQGANRPAGRLLRDVLYHIAVSAPVTERVRDIKRVFELDVYQTLSTAVEAPARLPGASDDDMAALRDVLAGLKACWTQVSSGDEAQLGDFLRQSEMLHKLATDGSQQDLKQALADIQACAAELSSRGQAPDALFSIEMATTLLMLESALAAVGKPRDGELRGLSAQTAAMRGMLLGTAQPAAAPEAGHAETLAVLSQVADEIRTNLQRIEQVLDDFFRDAETREGLPGIAGLFKQVAGAFEMLDHPTAATVVRNCQVLVERFARSPSQTADGGYDLVAESISALGFYLDKLLQGDAGAARVIESLPARLQLCLEAVPALAAEPLPAEAVQEVADAEPESVVDRALDAELLDVYLTEANEVQETIAVNLQRLRDLHDDHEALVTVRRAFHTLKGSGRTVGLTAMGDVAWAVEQLLNQLLETRTGVDAAVLDFIAGVCREFQGWMQQLTANGTATLIPATVQAQAEALRHRPVTTEAAAPAAAEEPPLPATEEIVVIGGTRVVDRKLFGIFLEEAYSNLEILFKTYAAACQHSAPPLPDVARAAHTLAGVSRTVGLTALAEMGVALELWLERVMPRFQQLAPEELRLFDRSLIALQEMLLKAAHRTLPRPATWLCGELSAAAGVPPGAEALEARLLEQSPADPAEGQAAVEVDEAPSSAQETGEIDRQLLEIFLEESNELMPMVGRQLREWQESPAAAASQQALQRALHTLKGSARMAGANELGDVLHDLETHVAKAAEQGSASARSFTGFFRLYDRINDMLEALHRHVEVPPAIAEAASMPVRDAAQAVEPIAVTPMMRVRSDVIDLLVNEAGEVSIARSRVERQMETFKQALLELTDSVIRLRSQLREAEIEAETQMQSRLSHIQETHETFDPLEFDRYTRFQELTRMMAESVHDVATIQQGLLFNLNETEAALIEQSRMTKELQQGLMRTRMVRFDNIAERLHRIVRQTSGELGKQATLEIRGGGVEIDRSVLEKMVAPLEHLLRNALAHGLENARGRASQGKPKAGRIALHARQEGNEIILSLSDDGRGLDYDKIKAKAAALGMLDAAAENDPASLMSLIFESGFSTSDAVTQVAGRGVGLDAVRTDITALGGRIEVASEAGRGCTFTVFLPLTLAVNQTVLVRTGQEEYLLPAPMVEQVQKLKPGPLALAEQQGHVAWAGNEYPLHHLSRLLGRPLQPGPQPYMPLLLLRSGARRIALVVDEIRGNREIVVKNIGPQLAGMSSIAGATVMGDGKVMLILNPIQMAFREALVTDAGYRAPLVAEAECQRGSTIMVVDDSLTMRKVITRLLVREGYRAVTAKDGVDALQQLQSVMPDVILLDIEMPRMDGFELTRAIRGDARTAHIPIIVISSRTADKHRKYGAEVGVNVYLGKPYQEEELLSHIAAFLPLGQTVTETESLAG